VLLEKILGRDGSTTSNQPPAAHLLELYAQCLAAVRGRSHEPRVFH
jgi:hypothetical protein